MYGLFEIFKFLSTKSKFEKGQSGSHCGIFGANLH